MGPNGSGKSTLIKTITRELYPLYDRSSSMELFGQGTWNVSELRSMLGIVSNDIDPLPGVAPSPGTKRFSRDFSAALGCRGIRR